jgi:hypothetical protein
LGRQVNDSCRLQRQAAQNHQPNGNLVVPYVKKGYDSITVIANASVGDKPSNPAAKGTIAFDLPVTDQKLPPGLDA